MTKKQLESLHICCELFHASTDEHNYISKHVQRAIFLKSALWNPGDTIKVSFLPMTESIPEWYSIETLKNTMNPVDTLDPIEYYVRQNFENDPEGAVKYIINTKIKPLVNLKIVWVDEDGDMRIQFDSTKGSWSLVGKQIFTAKRDEPTTNYGWLDVGTIIHEFCHVLGMLHEHQNPLGKSIQWNIPMVYNWANATQGWDDETTKENIIDRYKVNNINGSKFDIKSIMLYSYPPEITLNGKGTPANHKLSDLDIQWLKKIYPHTSSSKPLVKNESKKPEPLVKNNSKKPEPLVMNDSKKTMIQNSSQTIKKSAAASSKNIVINIWIMILYILLLCTTLILLLIYNKKK